MKTITLLNEKGGVGKTTLATHIAAGLALKGNRVVLIDADAQGNSSSALGLEKEPGFYDLCVRNADWKDILRVVHPDVYSPPDSSSKGQLLAVPSNHESRLIGSAMSKRSVIRNRIRELSSAVNFIVIDTSPAPSLLNESILLATDYVLIPTDCEVFSASEGVPDSIDHITTASSALAEYNVEGSKILGIIPNKYRVKTVLHNEVLGALRETYGNLVWEPLRQSVIISETQATLQFLYAVPDHPLTKQMWEFVDRVERVGVPNG